MAATKPFVAKLDLALGQRLKQELIDRACELSQPPHTVFQGKKKGLSCTLYQSGKLVVAGKDSEDFIRYYLEPELLQSFTLDYAEPSSMDLSPRSGVDESGKGDVFGPLTVAAVYADAEGVKWLHEIGVADSKTLSDARIAKFAVQIRKRLAHHVLRMNPAKYNELYPKFGNLNSLLAWGHATVIENLYKETQCPLVIVDQFASEHVVQRALSRKGLDLDLRQRHKAESDAVVAAASILARDEFVRGLERLSQQFAITLPKGANSPVLKAGKAFVAQHGFDGLVNVAKMHFKTIDKFR